MATIIVTSNARQVSSYFLVRADGVKLFGAAASGTLAAGIKQIMLPLLVGEAPKGLTGQLAQSQTAISTVMPGGARITFAANRPYAGFVLHGTGIYFDGGGHSAWDVDKFQAFTVQGSMVYTRHTHHEGQQPNDWVDRAWKRAERPILTYVNGMLGAQFRAVFV